jgi:hypothetical protein
VHAIEIADGDHGPGQAVEAPPVNFGAPVADHDEGMGRVFGSAMAEASRWVWWTGAACP